MAEYITYYVGYYGVTIVITLTTFYTLSLVYKFIRGMTKK